MKLSDILNYISDRNLVIFIVMIILACILISLFGKTSEPPHTSDDKSTSLPNGKEYLDNKIKFLSKSIRLSPNKEYEVADNVKSLLISSYFAPHAIKKLVRDIFGHFCIPFDNMEVNVEFDDSASRFSQQTQGPAGTYTEYGDGRRAITIVLKQSYGFDQIVAIACHECAHAFLFRKAIKLEPTSENEMLTDITAIYLGCGKYLLKGYAPINRVSTETTTTSQITRISSSSIGYINMEQCRYVYKKVCKLRKLRGARKRM